MLKEFVKNFSWFSHLFPEDEKIERELHFIGINTKNNEYLSFTFSISLFFAIIVLFFSFLFEFSPLFSIVLFAAFFFSLKYTPNYLYKRKINQMESELPFFLKTFKISLEVGNSFETALSDATKLSGGALSKEIKIATKGLEVKGNVVDALSEISEIDSTTLNRAINQLIFIYREGSGLEGLDEIAKEVLMEKKMKIREFNSKFSLYGLLFIASSLLLPAFFTAYVVVGSSFLDISLSGDMILLYYILVFPLVSLLMLLTIKMKTPPPLLSEKRENYEFNDLEDIFGLFLGKRELKINLLIYEAFVFAFWYALNFDFQVVFLLAALLPLFLLLSYSYKREREIEEKEDELIPILFNMAAKSDNVIEAIKSASEGKSKLSRDFKTIYSQIKAGYSITESINLVLENTDSLLLKRALSLIKYGSKVGESISNALKDTAEEIYDLFTLLKERSSAMSLQKYTLLLGAILNPIIIVTVLSFSSSLPNTLDFGVSEAVRQSMLSASRLGVQIYFLLYSLLSGVFISMEEGRNRALIYFLFMASVSFAIFYIL